MKCPKCEREMKKGYLHNGTQPIQWIPENRKPSIWRGGVAEGAAVCGEENFWKGYRAEAHYCSACKVVILPTK